MRGNLFDVHGNYLYCVKCIVHSLGIQSQKLGQQWQIKVRMCQEPAATMTKKNIVANNLQKFAIMVASAWWKTLSDDSEVEVKKLPHKGHGLASKASTDQRLK